MVRAPLAESRKKNYFEHTDGTEHFVRQSNSPIAHFHEIFLCSDEDFSSIMVHGNEYGSYGKSDEARNA
jgi:hypothetical protein